MIYCNFFELQQDVVAKFNSLQFRNNYKKVMSFKTSLNKSHWNDSMHIFFSPKLSLEGKNLLPQLVDANFGHRQQNFLTVFKKPITNTYDKIIAKKQRKHAVLVVGETKQVQKRTQTTENKKRNISVQLQEQFMKNYRETINQVTHLHNPYQRKGLIYNKANHAKEKADKQKYYFYVGPGNNSELVEQILNRRGGWQQTTSSIYHFRWEQTRQKYHNNTINKQLLNHLPNHEAISDKVGLVNSLKSYCDKNAEYMFSIIPACFYFDFGNLQSCQNEIKRFIQFYFEETERIQRPNDFSEETPCANLDTNGKTISISPRKMSKNQSNPSISANISVTNQTKNFRSSKKQPHYTLPSEINKKKQEIKVLHRTLLSKLKTYYNFVDMSAPKKQNPFLGPIHYSVYGNTCLWLLKPADLNRGRGIHLFRTIQQLGDLLKTQLSRHEKGSFLVQKYIQRPMLINSRKFDIRVYSMITQNKQVYFFKEGYIRTSSTVFDVSSTNYFTHLTNNAIQKYSKTYGQFQEGNILPLHFLFRQCGKDKKKVYDEIKRNIKICTKAGFSKMFNFSQKLPQVASSSVATANQSLLGANPKIKYIQIFGYDFMLDETGHVWLIEVNTNPCIQLSNQWLKCIIPRMLDDAFKLTIDKVFPKGKQPKENPQSQQYYPVPEYQNDQIMWEYLDLKTESQVLNSSSVIS